MPFHPDYFPPADVEDNPDRTGIAASAYGWPDELVAAMEAEVTTKRPAPSPAWRCDLHGWTTGDCKGCDDELISLTEDTIEGGVA